MTKRQRRAPRPARIPGIAPEGDRTADVEAFALTDPLLRFLAPYGRIEEFARLFALRAAGMEEEWGGPEASGWRLSRRLWAVADACAAAIRPYASAVARGHHPGSLEALSRLPVELLDERRSPALARLRGDLEALLPSGPAVVPWSELWGAWWEGAGGGDPLAMARLLESMGYGLEPDPRLGRRPEKVVALFPTDPSSPGPTDPHRQARAPFALAAPVLAATGLGWPPVGWWTRLVALSDLPAEAAPRMEAHLAWRAATGMRPGPIRRPLGEMSAERRRALGRILTDLVLRQSPPGEAALGALDRALRLLGLRRWAPDPPGGRQSRGVSATESLGAGPGPEEEEETAPPGGRGRGRRRGAVRVAPHLREALDDWVAAGATRRTVRVGALGGTRPLDSVLRSLAGCQEPVEPGTADRLGLEEGSTYGDAVALIRARLGETEPDRAGRSEEVLGIPGPEGDSYDPGEPLANLGWPVVHRGALYRVGDEALLGLEGQPDLLWGAFDPSEVLPAPEDVVAADAAGA